MQYASEERARHRGKLEEMCDENARQFDELQEMLKELASFNYHSQAKAAQAFPALQSSWWSAASAVPQEPEEWPEEPSQWSPVSGTAEDAQWPEEPGEWSPVSSSAEDAQWPEDAQACEWQPQEPEDAQLPPQEAQRVPLPETVEWIHRSLMEGRQPMWWPGASSPGASGDNVGAMQGHLSQWEVDAETQTLEPMDPWHVEQQPAPAPKAASDASAASSIWRDEWHEADHAPGTWTQWCDEADQSSWAEWHEAYQSSWTQTQWRDEAYQSSWTQTQWRSSASAWKPPPMLSPEEFFAPPPMLPPAEFFAPPPMLSPAPKQYSGRKARGGKRLNWFTGLHAARKRGYNAVSEYVAANPVPPPCPVAANPDPKKNGF